MLESIVYKEKIKLLKEELDNIKKDFKKVKENTNKKDINK